MSERSRRMLPVLMLMLASQAMLLNSHRYHGGYYPDLRDVESRVMTEHYRLCPAYWIKATLYDLIEEEQITCIGEEHASATVYHLNQKWIAYGWGLEGGEYSTQLQAERGLEKQITRWNQKPPLPKVREMSLWSVWRRRRERGGV